jgi:hypothetical protein
MDDLGAVLAGALALLAEGAAQAASPWRTPALATMPEAGSPSPPGLRTVVLRRFDAGARLAEIHTDARAPKIGALRADPRAALHGWDPARRVQIRLDGAIAVAGPAETEAAWAALPDSSRSTYAVRLAPGTPIARPDGAGPALPPEAARAVFTVLHLRFDALEALSLAHGAHRRARFLWSGGARTATWLVP